MRLGPHPPDAEARPRRGGRHWATAARRIALSGAAAVTLYLLVALALVVTDPWRPATAGVVGFGFAELIAAPADDLPARTPYRARDGAPSSLRRYPSSGASDTVLVLLHGSGWHGQALHTLAAAVATAGAAHVVVPDLRGHGVAPVRRGDVDHIGQLEEDVADLIALERARHPGARVVVGGHSSGGGLAVRFAGGPYGAFADGLVLLAPYLGHDAPTTRADAGGWARPQVRRIVGLGMLDAVGIRALHGLPVISFAMPHDVLAGPLGATATTAYSYRLQTSFAPRPGARDLATLAQPFALVVGSADTSFIPEAYEPFVAARADGGTYVVLDDATHLGLLVDPRTAEAVVAWLDRVDLGEQHDEAGRQHPERDR